jgi:hypothetical protein
VNKITRISYFLSVTSAIEWSLVSRLATEFVVPCPTTKEINASWHARIRTVYSST